MAPRFVGSVHIERPEPSTPLEFGDGDALIIGERETKRNKVPG